MPELKKEFASSANNSARVYSTEVNDIISSRPGWLVRNGILLFLIILLIIIISTFFIEYPDIVNANAKLVSINPPVEIKTKLSGKLIRLYSKEKDTVSKGTIIGVLESVADADKVIALENASQQIKYMMDRGETISAIHYFEEKYQANGWNTGLGELQADYNSFLISHRLFKQYLERGFYLKKKEMLNADISFMQKLHSNLLQQKGMQEEDVALAEKNFKANESLNKDKVIADVEYRNERSKFINKSLSLPQLNASILSNEASMHEKRKEILQLENEISQQRNIYEQALNSFIVALEQWQDKYLIIAPITGKVVFADFIQVNQYYPTGQTICLVNPANTSVYAQLQIPQNNFGKIKPGQQVLLKLPAYPYQEFGILKGELDYISQIPTDSGFVGKIKLPNGLLTNQQKYLQYREGLKAQVEIITSERKLSDRLFSSLKSVLDRQ